MKCDTQNQTVDVLTKSLDVPHSTAIDTQYVDGEQMSWNLCTQEGVLEYCAPDSLVPMVHSQHSMNPGQEENTDRKNPSYWYSLMFSYIP